MRMYVLAGDLGGTKTLLQIAEVRDAGYRVLRQERYASADFDSIVPLVSAFLSAHNTQPAYPIAGACLGVAGPVVEQGSTQVATLTNLPWKLDSGEIAHALALRVKLINDFQAIGYGIPALGANDLVTLQTGQRRAQAPCITLGAGTGLGQGLLIWRDDYYAALPTEGGHAGFAPTDAVQVDLLRYLHARFGRVSCERILSGSGFVLIYQFLRERGEYPESKKLAATSGDADPAPAITQAALADKDPLAVQAVDLFLRIYGAHAGDVALTVLASGGVYIAGGIAAKMIAAIQTGGFMQAFNDKGRMAPLTQAMPVHVVMNPQVGVMGAALMAARIAKDQG
jgi:glucokinase